MPYKDPEKERACGRRRYERITAERLARGMCPRCGRAKPAPDRTLCRPCGEKTAQGRARKMREGQGGRHTIRRQRPGTVPRVCTRQEQAARSGTAGRAHVHALWHTSHPLKVARCANRATWHGVTGSGNNMPRGGPPVYAAGAARRRPAMPPCCDRCARSAAKRSRKKAKNTRSRRRYVRRRVRGLCIDCAAPSQGASRCPPCARRSWARSGEHRGLPVLPPRVTVIEIATGKNHGTWDRWEDVVTCLAFAKLSRDQVELIPDM